MSRLAHQFSLRSNDSAQRMTRRQYDAATIHFRWGRAGQSVYEQAGPFHEFSATGRANRGSALRGKDGVALAADAFHK